MREIFVVFLTLVLRTLEDLRLSPIGLDLHLQGQEDREGEEQEEVGGVIVTFGLLVAVVLATIVVIIKINLISERDNESLEKVIEGLEVRVRGTVREDTVVFLELAQKLVMMGDEESET